MSREKLLSILSERVLVFDGAMGSLVIEEIGSISYPVELVNIESPDIPYRIHSAYVEAGADVITTNTFGATRIKLRTYGLEREFERINREAVRIAKRASRGIALVAGDIGPLGEFVIPFGKTEPQDAFKSFYEQAKILAESGVDLIIIETMVDLLEMKLALMAAKEATELPVIITSSFHEGFRTVTGSSPENIAIALEPLSPFAIGANCGGEPKDFPQIVQKFSGLTDTFIIVQPNAGLPRVNDEKTSYFLTPDELVGICEQCLKNGASIIGSCCGSTPQHTKALAQTFKRKRAPKKVLGLNGIKLTSRTRSLVITRESPLILVGERINPTGKKELAKELLAGSIETVKQLAISQSASIAEAIDLNLCAPGVDEPSLFRRATVEISKITDLPIIFDSTNIDAFSVAFWYYPGRPVLNSVTAKKNDLENLLELAKKFGAAIIILPINENGVPTSPTERIRLIKKMVSISLEMGFNKNDILVDPVVLPVVSEPEGARATLETIKLIVSKLGLHAICGISNISFGLPERGRVNSIFLALARYNGLSAAFVNPEEENIKKSALIINLLMGFDKGAKIYTESVSIGKLSFDDPFKKAILTGDNISITKLVTEKLKELKPIEIIENHLIPAIREAGKLYEEKKFYLSQLIAASETMANAMKILDYHLKKSGSLKGKILLATVEGDMHDIGKNLVGMILRSYGYTIEDLGKNVKKEKILERCRKGDINAVGLSSLMTSTIPSLKTTITAIKQEFPHIPIVVGGATLSEELAIKLGADGYASEATLAPEIFEKLINKANELGHQPERPVE